MTNAEKKDSLEAFKKIVGNHNMEYIDIDDSFGFKCQQCGKCCMNRGDIIINPFDVYNAAKYLGITTSEFIEKYTNIDLGGQSKIPMVLLSSNENGFCPLLKFDVKDGGKFKCTIHEAKPGACANHPIGVVRSIDKATENEEMQFIKTEQCPNSVSDEMHTVRDWVQPYLDNQEEIKLAHKIQTLVTDYFDSSDFWRLLAVNHMIIKTMGQAEKLELIEKLQEAYVSNTIGLGYAEYDTSKPFIEQATKNIEGLNEFYTKIKILYNGLKKAFKSLLDDIASNGTIDEMSLSEEEKEILKLLQDKIAKELEEEQE